VWLILHEICQPNSTTQVHFKPQNCRILSIKLWYSRISKIMYFNRNVFAGNPDPVRSEQALFAKVSQNWGNLTTPRNESPGTIPKPDSPKPPPPKQAFFPSLLLQTIWKTICQPKGNNEAGLPHRKTGYF